MSNLGTQTQPATVREAKPQGDLRLTYTHEAMIDLIIQEPTVTAKELATLFGYSSNWISRVIGSDSFQARLGERKAALVDPVIARSVNERFRAVAIRAADIIQDKLDAPEQSAAYAIEALGIATKAVSSVTSTRRKD